MVLSKPPTAVLETGRKRRTRQFFPAMREIILAVAIDQAHVNMQAIAGILHKGLGHEAGNISVLACDRLDPLA